MLIDTHVHLNSKELYPKIEQVIEESKRQGVGKWIVVGYDLETSKLAIEISEKYSDCYAAIGFHPTEIKEYTEHEYQWLEQHLPHPKVVAIGECGYDFHWDITTKEEQERAFSFQIELAKKYNKPLIIHSRDAIQLTYDTLKQHHAERVGGVLHSFSGSFEMARQLIELQFFIGISGPVTFQNGKTMKEVVEKVDLKYLLSETDSPYLTPHPYRGKENGPKYIPLIVQKIAEIKGISIKEVENQIEKNVNQLFGV